MASVLVRRSCCSHANEGLRVLPGTVTPNSCTTEVSDNHLPEAMASSRKTLHTVIPHLRKELGLGRCGFLGQFSLCLAGYHKHTLFESGEQIHDLEKVTAMPRFSLEAEPDEMLSNVTIQVKDHL